MTEKQSSQNSLPINQMILNSTMFYGAIAVVALLVIHFQHHSLASTFRIQVPLYSVEILTLTTLMAIGILLITSYFFEEYFVSYKTYKGLLVKFIGGLTLPAGVYLATITALAEELMFQGAVLPEVGAAFTAFLFTLVHIGPGNKVGPWTLMAFITGLIFAWIYSATGTIWPSLVGHIGINIIYVLQYRRAFQKWQILTEKNSMVLNDEKDIG